ncbi:extracellular solute-binding protein [Vallitalea okinawensis]|uniref:extracellular solute-binding protein n=1 Tax=Vallitalea okinawensis TaxID=2078660 RepID=UPI001300AE35|nr:extracellular solute-binding protein [Vallitalea okinawensis]
MRKRFLLLGIGLLLIILTGCNEKPLNNNESKNPLIEGEEEINSQKRPVEILTAVTGGKDFEENELWEQEVERLSGIAINIRKISGSSYNAKVTTTVAAGENVDLIYMNTDIFESLYQLHLFMPLTEQIMNSSVLGDFSLIPLEEWNRIRADDGEIYAVFNKYEGGRLPLIRWDWLENLGLEAPQNMEEYYQVLKAFTYDDPDGNGIDDTYGITSKNIYDIQPFMGSAGLVDGYAKEEDGDWYIPYATQEAIPVYEWLAKLYKEGIYDPNFATNSSSNCREAVLTGRVGLFVYWDNWTGIFNQKAISTNPDTPFEIRGIQPPVGQNGEASLTKGQDGLWVIPTYSEEKESAFKFLEFLHTYEGTIVCTLGIEGYDYEKKDGQYILTDIGRSHAMDHGIVQPKSQKWTLPIDAPKNYLQSKEIILSYGKNEVIRSTSKAAEEIVTKYAVKAILGSISSEEAVQAMQEELALRGYID